MQLEESKLELLEQESSIKMEKLKAEAKRERLNVEKELTSKSLTAEGRDISRWHP